LIYKQLKLDYRNIGVIFGGGDDMKVKVALVSLMLVLAFSAIWYFTPKHYNNTLDGVYYQLGKEDVIENVKVHLNGKLRYHINGTNSFKGVIHISGEQVPQIPKDRTKLELLYSGGNFASIVSFYGIKKDGTIGGSIYHYGAVYINDDFTEFTIALTNDTNRQWKPTDGFMITAPAKDRREAILISQQLMKKFGTIISN
jgi:hypothetical protein